LRTNRQNPTAEECVRRNTVHKWMKYVSLSFFRVSSGQIKSYHRRRTGKKILKGVQMGNQHDDPQAVYEDLVKHAFSYASGSLIGTGCDPARLGVASAFRDDGIPAVKGATIYSIEILTYPIVTKVVLDDSERNRLDNYARHVLNAPALLDIYNIIQDFNATVIEVYFENKGGILSLQND
jgi:hypothetical protein